MKFSVRYFPFTPGIPWSIKNGRYIIPKINKIAWDTAVDGRDFHVIAYGGLFESFFSLSILEALHLIHPEKKIYWSGFNQFNYLCSTQGIAKINKIDEKLIQKYPCPIFLDKEKFVYFNCLNNYIDVYSYAGEYGYHNQKAVVKQIFDNSLLEWKNNIPIFRNLEEPIEFSNFKQSRKFNITKPFILLIPDSTGLSIHNNCCLDWHVQDVKSFSAMLSQKGINLVILSTNTFKYTGVRAFVLDWRLDFLLWLLPKAKYILSKDIDILLMSLIYSNATIIAKKQKKEFSLLKNQKFLQSSNKMFLPKKLTPIDAFWEIK